MSHNQTTCENILPYYKQYQIENLSLRPTLQDYALQDFRPSSVDVGSSSDVYVKELRHYLSKAQNHVKHLKKSLVLRQRFYERHHIQDEDEGHKFARIKFAQLTIDAEQKLRMWQSKLQELTFAERSASFLPQTCAFFPYSDRNKPKASLKKKPKVLQAKRTSPRSRTSRSGTNDILDYTAIRASQKEKDDQEALLRKFVHRKTFDGLWLWKTLAAQAKDALRDGSDEMLDLFKTLGVNSLVSLTCENVCPCNHPEAFISAAGMYVHLMLSRKMTRPKHVFTSELRFLFYCSSHDFPRGSL